MTETNSFRARIIRMVMHPLFDHFILVTIITNCVFLAIADPTKEEPKFMQVADYVFLAIYTFEGLMKILAMGFIMMPYTYLRDPWNVLDFLVLIMAYIGLGFQGSNVSAIRVVRILRPLRTINSVPGMKGLVESMLNSLPMLFDILILFLFVLMMMGTVAT
jgi:hypothetical protein